MTILTLYCALEMRMLLFLVLVHCAPLVSRLYRNVKSRAIEQINGKKILGGVPADITCQTALR